MVNPETNNKIVLSQHPKEGLKRPGLDLASNRKKYQEYFLGVKVAGVYGLQPYHHHVPTVSKSGSLKFLGPSGPVIVLYSDCFAFYLTSLQ
jgi:hypothetical protein